MYIQVARLDHGADNGRSERVHSTSAVEQPTCHKTLNDWCRGLYPSQSQPWSKDLRERSQRNNMPQINMRREGLWRVMAVTEQLIHFVGEDQKIALSCY